MRNCEIVLDHVILSIRWGICLNECCGWYLVKYVFGIILGVMSQKVVLQIHQGDTNISFNKSDNIFLSKTILILFVRCLEKKARNTLGTYLPEIFLTNLLGWLVISQKCPKHFFGHYPSAILLEISPTNSPCRNFTYTRICSNRSVFFCTKQNLHQKIFTPKNFSALHQTVFTSRTFDTKGFLHQKSLPP